MEVQAGPGSRGGAERTGVDAAQGGAVEWEWERQRSSGGNGSGAVATLSRFVTIRARHGLLHGLPHAGALPEEQTLPRSALHAFQPPAAPPLCVCGGLW